MSNQESVDASRAIKDGRKDIDNWQFVLPSGDVWGIEAPDEATARVSLVAFLDAQDAPKADPVTDLKNLLVQKGVLQPGDLAVADSPPSP